MKISYRVKQNIRLALFALGILLVLARGWEVIIDPHSRKAWFQFIGIIIITYGCYDSYATCRKQHKKNIE